MDFGLCTHVRHLYPLLLRIVGPATYETAEARLDFLVVLEIMLSVA